MKRIQRLHILNEDDVSTLYERPNFTDVERRHFFSIPEELLSSLKIRTSNKRRTPSIVYFIMQYGYFKAKHQFFSINLSEVLEDLKFIMRHYLPNDFPPKQLPSSDLQRTVRQTILSHYSFSDDKPNTRQQLSIMLKGLARRTNNPVEIFDEVIKLLNNKRCVIPPYTVLQDAIGAAFKDEEDRLVKQVRNC